MEKKRVMSIALSTVMAASMILSGCGSKAESSASAASTAAPAASTAASTASSTAAASSQASTEPVTVNFWTISLQPTFTDFFNGLIANYEKENPNVTIKWTDLPYESIQEKLVTSAAGGTAPDVVNLNTQITLSLAGKGALVDLNKEATDDQRSIYIKSLYDSTVIGDSGYSFPWYASPNIMFYNKDLFDKAGITQVPTTYEEANKVAKQMKDKTGAYMYNPPEFFNLLFEEGIPVLNSDNTAAAYNTDATKQLITTYQGLAKEGTLPNNKWGSWDDELKLFETGKLAIISSSGSSLSRIKDEAPDVYKKIVVAAPLTGSKGISRNALMDIVVPSASKNHAEAIKFAAWITNDENQLAFCKQVAIFPSTTKAAADPYFTSDTTTLEGQARAMSAKISDKTMDYSLGVEGQSDIQDAVNKTYEAAITSGKDAQQSLDNSEKLVNGLLKK